MVSVLGCPFHDPFFACVELKGQLAGYKWHASLGIDLELSQGLPCHLDAWWKLYRLRPKILTVEKA